MRQIYGSKRESDEERLFFMVENFDFYFRQMRYKQWFFQFKVKREIGHCLPNHCVIVLPHRTEVATREGPAVLLPSADCRIL